MKIKKNFLLIIKCLVIIIIFIFSINMGFGLIFAQTQTKQNVISLAPVIIEYSLKAGEVKEDKLFVSNPSNQIIGVRGYTEDFLTTDEEGSPKSMPLGILSSTSSLGSWIKLSFNEFVLNPQESKEVSFKIIIPNDAEPGGHYAEIIFGVRPEYQAKSAGGVGVLSEVAGLVLVNIEGENRKTGEVISFATNKKYYFSQQPINFLVRFKNTGNTHYKTDGKIIVKDIFGRKLTEIQLKEHIINPDSIRKFEGEWQKRWMLGRYSAKTEIKDGNGEPKTAETVFWVINWKIVIIIVGIIFLIVALISALRFRRKKHQEMSKSNFY